MCKHDICASFNVVKLVLNLAPIFTVPAYFLDKSLFVDVPSD